MKTLFLVGDSTVANYDLTVDDKLLLFPRNGYGMWIPRFFHGSIFVRNLALSGRSSKSFLREENYSVLQNTLKSGDYLMIAFGHNDEKFHDESRFTFGGGDIEDENSFKFHLYNFYIKLARDRGATPILCTPIVRRSLENDYVGDRVHKIPEVTVGGMTYPASDYSLAVRELGRDLKVPVIDMTKSTRELYQSVGAEKAAEFHATLSFSKDDVDNTHLNSFGAAVVARLFAENLKNSDCDLRNDLLDDFFVPTIFDRGENSQEK